ncbi:hypothetical protein COCNU_01G004290 [Cocos nucifera]|uniref:Uncharacterized protein n=1 Tax=Cocos nucifera TaxID=13894 RepID=A0A8K0HUN5_COCNU|nr:hypothetical protein COCNU_01G004290 [Cocos nucifera]
MLKVKMLLSVKSSPHTIDLCAQGNGLRNGMSKGGMALFRAPSNRPMPRIMLLLTGAGPDLWFALLLQNSC